jgi:riboflavin synthase
MFTGLIEAIGRIERRGGSAGAARARLRTAIGPLVLGESVSVDGVCLTVDRIVAGGFEADMSPETLARTTLGGLAAGAEVHLERATPAGGRLGGHIVLGHVDGVGRVTESARLGDAIRLGVAAPGELARFIAPKGSIAVSGVSLTVNRVRDDGGAALFDVMLVPHTLGSTKLARFAPGDAVNLEVDVLARYVARVLEHAPRAGEASRASHDDDHGTSDDARILAKLRQGGFA